MPFTGNSNYVGLAAAAIEKTVRRDWRMIWTTLYPFFAYMEMKGNHFNKGFGIDGTAMLLAIMGGDQTTPAEGVTDANQTTAMTYNRTTGFTQAKYEFNHYRANYTIDESEARLAAGGQRGDLLDGKKKQVLNSFKKRVATDAAGTAADSRDKILGMGYPLSTSNTVGGISQTTDPVWAAQVSAGVGAFTLSLIDDKKDAIKALGRSAPDFVAASYSGTGTNVYGKIRDAIAPAQRVVNDQFTAKYGFDNIEYLNMTIVMDNLQASGEFRMFSTDTWYVYFDKQPRMHPTSRIPGTDSYENFFTMWTALGTDDPACNGRDSGIV